MLIRENRLLASSTLMVSLAICSAAQGTETTAPIAAPTTFTSNYAFPPVGLAFPETLQVSAVNVPVPSLLAGDFSNLIPSTAVLPSCAGTGTITFTNASGMIIGAPIPFTVPFGQIFSAPLPFSMTGYPGFRGEILVSLHITTSISCSLSISLETFDTNTGVTHAIQSAAITAPLAVITTIGVPRGQESPSRGDF
jgi:hypothetical protein